MLYLARHQESPVLLRQIAADENISEGYLEHLIPMLKSTKLIHSIRGPRGGYMLARNPAQITLKDVVEAMEGETALVDCVANPSICDRTQSCPTHDIWKKLSQQLAHSMETITLDMMLQTDSTRFLDTMDNH